MSDEQQPPPFTPGPTPELSPELPPYPPAPPPPPPLPSSQRFPTWKQAFVMFGGGLALAISACFGCLFTLDFGGRRNSALEGLSIFLGILAFVGLIGTLVGVVLVLMRMLRALFAKKDESRSGSTS
jgi:hypothetical protein